MANAVVIDLEVRDKDGTAKVQTLSASFKDLGSTGIQAGAAVGAGMAVAEAAVQKTLQAFEAIVEEAGRVVEKASYFSDMSAKLDMSAESAQKLAYMGSLVGVSFDQMASASLKLQKNLAEHADVFKKWGLDAAELRAMKPEEQFVAISEAIRSLGDRESQVSAITQMLGKGGAQDLALFRQNLADLNTEADSLGVAMGDNLVGKLDNVGDATTRLEKAWEGLKDEFVGGIVAASGADDVLNNIAKLIGLVNVNAKEGAAGPLALWVGMIERLTGLNQLKDAVSLMALMNETSPAVKSAGPSIPGINFGGIDAAALAVTKEQVKETDKVAAATKRAAEAAAKHAEEAKYTLEIQKDMDALVDKMADDMARAVMKAPVHNLGPLTPPNLGPAGILFDPNSSKLSESTTKQLESLDRMAAKYHMVADAAAELARVIGGPLGTALGGVTGIFDALTARSQQAKENLENYGKTAMTTGQKVQAMAGALSGAVQAYKSHSLLGGAASGAAAGAAFGPVGAVIGGVAGGILGLFGKKSADKKELEDLKGQYAALMAEAQKAGVVMSKAFNPKTVQDYKAAIEGVKSAMNIQEQSQQALNDALQRYNFSESQMGPILQKQNLDKQAAQLYQDWQVLNGAMVDHNAILQQMGPSINQYVQAAVGAGQEIPSAMQPIIDDMIKHGQLLDENGQAYTSAEQAGIHYATTMSQMFQDLIKSVQQLVDAIASANGMRLPSVGGGGGAGGGGGEGGGGRAEAGGGIGGGHTINVHVNTPQGGGLDDLTRAVERGGAGALITALNRQGAR